VILLYGWDPAGTCGGRPETGDRGTFVGGYGGRRVVFDRSATHSRVNFSLTDGVIFNGKQSWACWLDAIRYIGMRVNPDKV
jgi:hypothetical protein